VAAPLLWTGRCFEEGWAVEVGTDGRIAAVRRAAAGDLPLTDRALLPGFVNAHSHAFQRGLRGRGESFPTGAGSFWSWREEMYRLVTELDRAGVYDLSLQAFREMRAAGITTVGEFHYLHHDDPRTDGGGDFAFDRVVADAAVAAGIRLVLLSTYYESGGFGRPLEPAQERFRTATPELYWRHLDALAAELEKREAAPRLTVAATVHSLRAAPLPHLRAVFAEARRRGLPCHLHAEEQPREVEECLAAHGRAPLAIVLEDLDPGPLSTAVHGTHATPERLASFFATGAHLCVCPLTEANLGDGLPALPPAAHTPEALCLGTDSNARIGFLEEMRWLEYGQRLSGLRRGALADDQGQVAPVLLTAATAGGAAALALPAGRLAAGLWADLTAVDLGHPALAGATVDTLATALLCGAGNQVIAGTWVGGRG
jgi:formimidoylglutamate deiminase